MQQFDVAIVGGGPAGLTAALVLGRQRRKVLLLDADTPRNAMSQGIHMLPTRHGIEPRHFRVLAGAEVDALPTVRRVDGRVTDIAIRDGGGFHVTLDAAVGDTGAGGTSTVRRILLATGVRDVLERIPGLSANLGNGVYHCPFCHGFEVTGHRIAVVAGGWSGATMAAYLRDRFSDHVTWYSHGSAAADEAMLAFLGSVGVGHRPALVEAVERSASGMMSLTSDGAVQEFDSIFHRALVEQQSPLATQLGAKLLDDGTIAVDAGQQTCVPGLFAAGDCARVETSPGPSGFAATASGDGQRAAVWLEQSLLREDLDFPPPR